MPEADPVEVQIDPRDLGHQHRQVGRCWGPERQQSRNGR
jgi:hypothetical protein